MRAARARPRARAPDGCVASVGAVTVWNCDAAGFPTDDGDWMTRCEDHDCLATWATLADALSAALNPARWCGGCR